MTKEQRKEYDKQYRILNKEKIALRKKLYSQINREKENIRLKKYKEDNPDKVKQTKDKYNKNNADKIKLSKKNYVKNNPDKVKKSINQSVAKRKLIDPLFRIKCKLKMVISNAIRRTKFNKNSKSIQILGCSYEDFKKHIESLWESWMDWDNYGLYNGTKNYGWDIDHIIPQSKAMTEDELIKLNHYKNLKPLCGYINRVIKRDN